MEYIFKHFKHLSRDLYIYIIPSINVLLNCYLFLLEPKIQNIIQAQFISFYQNTGSLIVIALIIVVCFIIGHISMAVSEILIVRSRIDKCIKCICFNEFPKNDNNEEVELVTFEERDKYDYFVERDSALYLFRWNLASTFLLLIIISFFLTKSFQLMGIYFVLFIAVYFLSLKSEKTFINRRQQLYNNIKKGTSALND